MIIIKNGNLLEAKENILVHQVNVDGIMGAGVAKQIAQKYPISEKEYKELCIEKENRYEWLKGKVCLTCEKRKYIASIFSQDKNFNTDYESMRRALELVKRFAKKENLRVAIPYGIGCGIANGDWNTVQELIEEVFNDYCVTLYKLTTQKQYGIDFKEIIIDTVNKIKNLDIQVGDRVTYEIEAVKTKCENNVCTMQTVKEKRTALVTMDQIIIEKDTKILKIERIGRNGWCTVYEKEEC